MDVKFSELDMNENGDEALPSVMAGANRSLDVEHLPSADVVVIQPPTMR